MPRPGPSFRRHSRGDVLVANVTVREPDLTLMPLLDHSSGRTLGCSFARLDPAMQYQVARDDAGGLAGIRPERARRRPPGLGMRFGPNRRYCRLASHPGALGWT